MERNLLMKEIRRLPMLTLLGQLFCTFSGLPRYRHLTDPPPPPSPSLAVPKDDHQLGDIELSLHRCGGFEIPVA